MVCVILFVCYFTVGIMYFSYEKKCFVLQKLARKSVWFSQKVARKNVKKNEKVARKSVYLRTRYKVMLCIRER